MFSNLLNETKGFKYQFTVKVLLKKDKLKGEIDFALVYFNSVTKAVTNGKFRLENYFQEILYIESRLNQLSLNTLIFQLIDHYQEVLIWTYLLN